MIDSGSGGGFDWFGHCQPVVYAGGTFTRSGETPIQRLASWMGLVGRRLMRRVPKGKLTTIDELRKALARKHGATIGCPVTTGIFAWIAAPAAAEAEAAGARRFTRYGRTLKTKGELRDEPTGRSVLPTGGN